MLLDKLSTFLNRSPAEVAIEQIRKLYMRLYPYMATDFSHQNDVQTALQVLDGKIALLSEAIAIHIHATSPLGGTAPSGFLIPIVPTVLTGAYGYSQILPAGYPQPTGEGPPAIYPSRAASPLEVVAIPPLSPADFVG